MVRTLMQYMLKWLYLLKKKKEKKEKKYDKKYVFD